MPIPHTWMAVGVGLTVLVLLYLVHRYVFRARALRQRRVKAAHERRYPEVIALGRQELALRRADVDLLHDMAVALRRTGEADEAFQFAQRVQQALYQKQTGRPPRHPEDFGEVTAFYQAPGRYLRSMQVLGETYLERGHTNEAREIFEYLVGMGGRHLDCNTHLAESCLRQGDGEAAVQALRRFLNTNPVRATKAIRAHLHELVAIAPDLPCLRTFQVEFLKLEGRTREEFDRLCAAAADGTIPPNDLYLFCELARHEDAVPTARDALNAGAERLTADDTPARPLEAAATELSARRVLVALRGSRLAAAEEETTSTDTTHILAQLLEDGLQAGADSALRLQAIDSLLSAGDVEAAAEVLDATPPECMTEELLRLAPRVRRLRTQQRLQENALMLAGRTTTGITARDASSGLSVALRPSRQYRIYLERGHLTDVERPRVAYDLGTALLATGQGRNRLVQLLQPVATGSSPCRVPAALRLSRLLHEEGDERTARLYLERVDSLERAAQLDRDAVLQDAYALARLREGEDPSLALLLYRDIALLDIDYADARQRRDALLDQGIEPASWSGAGRVANAGAAGTDEATLMSDNATLPVVNSDPMVDLVAGFGSNDAAPAVQEFGPGSSIEGRYRIEEALGEGGMGAVYRAEDIRLKRTVAVKVIHPGLGNDFTNAGERFIQEAQAAGQLFQHSGVITVLDFGEGPPPYIVMEYVEGESLRERLDAGALNPPQVLRILQQLAATLAFAHHHRIIHRDIKPANILLDARTQEAKVADFGLAKLADASKNLTMSGAIVGTRLYMSPEQIKGDPIDHRVDIYAWGIMAYEMVHGRPPFTEGEVSYQHVHVDPAPLSQSSRSALFPTALLDLIMSCLAKSPAQRPASFEAIGKALAAVECPEA